MNVDIFSCQIMNVKVYIPLREIELILQFLNYLLIDIDLRCQVSLSSSIKDHEPKIIIDRIITVYLHKRRRRFGLKCFNRTERIYTRKSGQTIEDSCVLMFYWLSLCIEPLESMLTFMSRRFERLLFKKINFIFEERNICICMTTAER